MAAALAAQLCGGPTEGSGDASLTPDWTRQVGSAESDTSYGIAALAWGDAVVAAVTEGDLGGPNSGGRDAFVARPAPDGEISWVRQFGSSGTDWTQGVDADSAGKVYVVGLTEGLVDVAR